MDNIEIKDIIEVPVRINGKLHFFECVKEINHVEKRK